MGFKALASALFTIALLAWSSLAFAESTPKVEVHLLTMGPGDHLYTRGGHAALMVARTGSDGQVDSVVYNYGDTDWEQSSIAMKFMAGTLQFFVSESGSIQDTVQRYGFGQDRDIYRQSLALSREQTETLVRRLEEAVKPANRDYAYHHLKSVCTTQVRDILNEVLDGAIADTLASQPHEKSIRQHQRFGTDGQNLVALASGLFLGRSHDRKPDKYFITFLPHLLRKYLREVMVPDPTGAHKPVPLVSPAVELYRRRAPPACAKENRITALLAFVWLMLIGLFGLWVYRGSTLNMRRAGWWLLSWSVLSSIIGLFIVVFVVISGVPEFRDNELIFSFPPTDLFFVLVAVKWIRGRPTPPPWFKSYLLLRLCVMLAVFLAHAFGFLFQEPFILPCLSTMALGFLLVIFVKMKRNERLLSDEK